MNPFIRLFEQPVETLLLGAYLLVLLALLVSTWYVLGRNFMTLYSRWDKEAWSNGTPYPPATWVLRLIAIPIVLAIDLLLIAAFVHFIAF